MTMFNLNIPSHTGTMSTVNSSGALLQVDPWLMWLVSGSLTWSHFGLQNHEGTVVTYWIRQNYLDMPTDDIP